MTTPNTHVGKSPNLKNWWFFIILAICRKISEVLESRNISEVMCRKISEKIGNFSCQLSLEDTHLKTSKFSKILSKKKIRFSETKACSPKNLEIERYKKHEVKIISSLIQPIWDLRPDLSRIFFKPTYLNNSGSPKHFIFYKNYHSQTQKRANK